LQGVETATNPAAARAAEAAQRARILRRLAPGGMLRVGLLSSCSHNAIAVATGHRE
jgi:hypothetical protein